jgi:hypothetical protein
MNTANLVFNIFKITTTKCGLETKEPIGVALDRCDALVLMRNEQRDLINDRRMTQKLQMLGFTVTFPKQLLDINTMVS